MFKSNFKKNNSGMTILEGTLLALISGGVLVSALYLIESLNSYQGIRIDKASLQHIRGNLINAILNSNSLRITVGKNDTFRCIQGRYNCFDKGGKFDLYLPNDTTAPYLETSRPSKGFSSTGEVCDGYSLENPKNNCNLRYDLEWSPSCPAGPSCVSPPLIIKGTLSLSNPLRKKLISINTQPLNFELRIVTPRPLLIRDCQVPNGQGEQTSWDGVNWSICTVKFVDDRFLCNPGTIVNEDFTACEIDVIYLTSNSFNPNLLAIVQGIIGNTLGTNQTLKVVIGAGTVIGSGSTASPALNLSNLPSGTKVFLTNRGVIAGAGGKGGGGGNACINCGLTNINAQRGGDAIRIGGNISLYLDNSQGIIGGGGGGGHGGPGGFGGGGGGGAGSLPGVGEVGGGGRPRASSGSLFSGGAPSSPGLNGGNGGRGGNLGQQGGSSTCGHVCGDWPGLPGAPAGRAIHSRGGALIWIGGATAARVKGAVN